MLVPPALPHPTVTDAATSDRLLERLRDRKEAWAQSDISQRLDYLSQCQTRVMAEAERWADACNLAKGVDSKSSLAGDEWLAGPMAVARNLRLLMEALASGGQPKPANIWQREDGQNVARVMPVSLLDRAVWLGYTGDVWIEPGRPASQGRIYREAEKVGRVTLVLGAGNISSIGPMDALYQLYVENSVVLLKFNPVNEYLHEVVKASFQPLIDAGFLALACGGVDLGRHLCSHDCVDSIHITGSHHTHDAIVWGETPEERDRNKAAKTPVQSKPITSELGCVTPVMVVPGSWSAADIQFQARQVASMVAHNASFNCNAAKVVVLAKGWPQRQQFVEAVRNELAKIPPRKAYYPGARDRYQAFLDRYPQAEPLIPDADDIIPWTFIPDVSPSADEYALQTEAFCGVLAEVSVDVETADEFLPRAVEFANTSIWGTLSCVLLVHPQTEKQHPQLVDEAIANLRYGAVAVNLWGAVAYGLVSTTWGAFPGHSLDDIRSGRGVVHNAFLFDYPQKSVVRAPFRISPLPLWFAGHRTLRSLAPKLVDFEAAPAWYKLPAVIWDALRG